MDVSSHDVTTIQAIEDIEPGERRRAPIANDFDSMEEADIRKILSIQSYVANYS